MEKELKESQEIEKKYKEEKEKQARLEKEIEQKEKEEQETIKKAQKGAGEAGKISHQTTGVDYTEEHRNNTTGASAGSPSGIGVDLTNPQKSPILAKQDEQKKAFVSAKSSSDDK